MGWGLSYADCPQLSCISGDLWGGWNRHPEDSNRESRPLSVRERLGEGNRVNKNVKRSVWGCLGDRKYRQDIANTQGPAGT